MNVICNNCSAKLSCSCQQRRASDGKQCCTACIQSYEIQLNSKKTNSSVQTSVNNVSAPTVNQITFKID